MLDWAKQLFGKAGQRSEVDGAAQSARHYAPEAQYSVSFDDLEIKLRVPDGREFTVAWDELVGVAIQTTDEGPFLTDVFWVLGTEEHSLSVPQGAQGESEFLARLQKLPGFDNEAVISAMSCTENHLFICWQREETKV